MQRAFIAVVVFLCAALIVLALLRVVDHAIEQGMP